MSIVRWNLKETQWHGDELWRAKSRIDVQKSHIMLPEEKEKAARGACVFYAAWEAVKKATEYIEEYCGECKMVDVLQAFHETLNLDM